MSKDALPEKACKLDHCYWRITNAEDDVQEVQGSEVVYEYTSCTTFSTTSSYMKGYKIFNVVIPRLHMAYMEEEEEGEKEDDDKNQQIRMNLMKMSRRRDREVFDVII
ncbi:hypothetical protein FD755_011262 [Muntiacus reevesi]|uniref:ApaG domain-containing protein n=1 Tax=Muntiacus reevesi TaxID=9886 RepID=A0A5N3XS84_MUNRE|nr:hypothetical protein FD755_011262 [Muntiacus reevesi]